MKKTTTKPLTGKRLTDRLLAELGTKDAEIASLHQANEAQTREIEMARKMEAHLGETINRLAAAEKEISRHCDALRKSLAAEQERTAGLERQLAEMRGYIARVNEDEAVRYAESHPPVEREVQQVQAPYRPFLDRFAPVKEEASWAGR